MRESDACCAQLPCLSSPWKIPLSLHPGTWQGVKLMKEAACRLSNSGLVKRGFEKTKTRVMAKTRFRLSLKRFSRLPSYGERIWRVR